MTGPDIVARRIGQERQAIAIIDDFHPDPAALRTHAASATFTPGLNHYPGVRAPLPAGYFEAVRPALTATLAGVFGHPGGIGLIDASFSIVTTPPERLATAQRLPHVDAIEPGRIALVHYLNPEDHDGTAFFRHRSTGFETLDAARSPAYVERLNAELRAGGAPDGYIAGSTPLFERTAAVEARYNRAVVYRSALLHSGMIATGRVLSDDPLRGRLTVTAFLMLA